MGEGSLTPPVSCSGRSKILWLHSLFSFLYFITSFLFMAHHCLGFVPKKSYKVRERPTRARPAS